MGIREKRYVQVFGRGLDVLVHLNAHDGASIGDVAAATGINRGIVYRLLETLRKKKFVTKDAHSAKYWLTGTVRNLSDGFNDEEWVEAIARPAVEALGRQLLWPITLSTPSGSTMLVRVSSDVESPLVHNRFTRGFRFSLPLSAAGQVYLAFSGLSRSALIEVMLRVLDAEDELAILRSPGFNGRLNNIRAQGYASVRGQPNNIGAIAVPIIFDDVVFGAISARYFQSALTASEAARRLRDPLQVCADAIAKSLSDTAAAKQKANSA